MRRWAAALLLGALLGAAAAAAPQCPVPSDAAEQVQDMLYDLWVGGSPFFAAAAAAVIIEYAYGLLLTRAEGVEQRARGYSIMYDSLEAFVLAALTIAVTGALAPLALAGLTIAAPEDGAAALGCALQRFTEYLVDLANMERDLTIFPITAPLVAPVTASSLLARSMLQALLFIGGALYFAATTILAAPLRSLMLALGFALTGVRRVKRLGPYMVFSVLSMYVVTGAAAPYIASVANSLEFDYGSEVVNPVEAIAKQFGNVVGTLIEDGKAAAQAVFTLSVGVAAAAAVAAAASHAAGGFADTIMSRLRW